jgi:hypothetical protein
MMESTTDRGKRNHNQHDSCESVDATYQQEIARECGGDSREDALGRLVRDAQPRRKRGKIGACAFQVCHRDQQAQAC